MATTNLHFILMGFPLLDITYKWNHTIWSLCTWLHSLSITLSKFMQVVASVRIFFLRLNNRLLYVGNTIHLSIHPLWTVDTAELFPLLTIKNTAAGNNFCTSFCVTVCFQFSFMVKGTEQDPCLLIFVFLFLF